MYNRTCTIVLILVIAFSEQARAQSLTKFENYTVDQGLSQNSAVSMLQDSTGFIWVGTQGGISKFDGISFKNYLVNYFNSPVSGFGRITKLYLDSRSVLWAASDNGVLHKYLTEYDRFDQLSILDSAIVNLSQEENIIVNDILEFNNNLLLGTNHGLYSYSESNNEISKIQYSNRDSLEVHDMVIHADGKLLVGDNTSLSLVHLGKNGVDIISSNELLKVGSSITKIEFQSNGNYLLGTFGHGVLQLDQKLEKVTQFMPGLISPKEKIFSLIIAKDGYIWIGTENNGAISISPLNESTYYKVTTYNEKGLLSNQILEIIEDMSGHIWIGTWDGISKASLNRNAIEYIGPDILTTKSIVSFEQLNYRYFLLGGTSGGVQLYDDVEKNISAFFDTDNSNICGNAIWDLEKGEGSTVWIASMDGGICSASFYNYSLEDSSYFFDFDEIGSFTDIQSVKWTSANTLFAGVWENGLKVIRFKDNKLSSTEDSFDELSDVGVWPIISGRGNKLWLGTKGQGIYRIDTSDFSLYPLNFDGNEFLGEIYDLTIDKGGNLWAATNSGAHRFDIDKGIIKSTDINDKLPDLSVRGIIEDNQESIWITSNGGLSKYSPSSGKLKTYYEEDGMQGNRYYARSVLKASDGRLFFGGDNGFHIIDPTKIRTDTTSSNIVLNEILIHGEPYNKSILPPFLTENLVLEPDESQVQLSFSLLNFVNPKRNSYKFRITQPSINPISLTSNAEVRWEELGNRNFLNIPFDGHGDYRLEIMGLSSDGIPSRNTIDLAITVEAYWWQTTWFRLLLILGAITLITGFVAVRLRHRLNIEKLRVSLAKKLHDDINGDLSTIGKRIRILKKRLKPEGDELKHLTLMNEMVQGMGDSVRDNTWLIDTREDTLKTLVEKMQSLAHMKLEGNVAFSFHQLPDVMPDIMIKLDFKQHIFMLYKESLNNIIKYAQAGHVTIEVELIDKQFVLKVKDDGIGFDEEEIRRGDGLENMTYRASQIKAHFEINSRPGCGTEVILQAPVQKHLSWELKLRSMLEKAGIL